ncbi:MAG: cobalt-precorrin-5B (C(1))-methyltransferase CbiD [Acetatifactor sp.]|nr:cobalt-precorrin-5B (C(1))-methyltransferase CbiD [Acetatifactor sp.]
MRIGFTTGSCAAAAAKAAAFMLLSGKKKTQITITTPKGIDFCAELVDIHREKEWVSCAVQKDGGDDPDVTTGAYVYATVSIRTLEGEQIPKGQVLIDGGEGVGRVTKPGLDQPVGNAAINSVPRSMIEKEIREVLEVLDYDGGLSVVISVPGGAKIAEKTFNPRLGIAGGISILGTSGVVEPMSSQALLDTIRVELNQKKALGCSKVVIAPGNYGLDFMKKRYGYDLDEAVKCSNYIGETLEMIAKLGFTDVLLCGHIGKLIKVSGGIMNTHSGEADCRMELMVAAALQAGVGNESLKEILNCISTDAGYQVIKQNGREVEFMKIVMEKIDRYLKKKAAERFGVECIVFSNEHGLLGRTDGADGLLQSIMEERTRLFI